MYHGMNYVKIFYSNCLKFTKLDAIKEETKAWEEGNLWQIYREIYRFIHSYIAYCAACRQTWLRYVHRQRAGFVRFQIAECIQISSYVIFVTILIGFLKLLPSFLFVKCCDKNKEPQTVSLLFSVHNFVSCSKFVNTRLLSMLVS